MHKLTYLKNHKSWLTMGKDHIIREYDLKRENPLILSVEVIYNCHLYTRDTPKPF